MAAAISTANAAFLLEPNIRIMGSQPVTSIESIVNFSSVEVTIALL